MPGEVIVGGNQIRTIGNELVIEPNEKPVPIDVYCVEHGRWSHADEEQAGQQLAAANQGVSDANAANTVGMAAAYQPIINLVAETYQAGYVCRERGAAQQIGGV